MTKQTQIEQTQTLTTYKGTDLQGRCRGHQYQAGTTYTLPPDAPVKVCESGYHACEYPLDTFSYYPPVTSRYWLTEQSGDLSRHAGDSKIASRTITPVRELSLADLIAAAVAYTLARTLPVDPASPNYSAVVQGAASNTGLRGVASNTGPHGAASNTGLRGAASNTGPHGAASNTGPHGVASNTGLRGAASNTGPRGAASNTGPHGAASNSGPHGVASNTGPRGAASNTGDCGAASNTGDYGASSNSGDYGAASNTGYRGAASNTGERGAASNTGPHGVASNTGERGAASNTGDYGAASNTGPHGVAASFGTNGRAMSDATGAICIVNRALDGSILHIRASKVGENGIEAGKWYILDADGNFLEVI